MSCDAPPSTEDLMPRRSRYDRGQTCIKCKSQRGNLVIKHTVYCSSCLPAMLVRKFRRALSTSLDPAAPSRGTPSRTPPPDVILGLSGGPSSVVLLDLVWKCFSAQGSGRKDERRQVGKVRAVHIDWSCLGRASLVESLKENCDHYGIDFTVVRGEEAFEPAWRNAVGLDGSAADAHIDLSSARLPFVPSLAGPSDPVATLRAHLRSLPTPTSVPATLHTLTRLLLLHTASSSDCSVLMLGTSLPRLSIDLLETVAYGGGFALGAEREEIVRTSRGDVKIVRPLRDWSLKELGWWLYSRQLSVPRGVNGKPTQALAPTGGKTIGKLTEDFVIGLERDYPSTVSTISKTAAKVVPAEEAAYTCAYCLRPAQKDATRWKAGTAIMSLPFLITNAATDPLTPPKTPPLPAEKGLADSLCYSCYTHLTARGGTGAGKIPALASNGGLVTLGEAGMPMPVWVQQKLTEEEMRESIGGFLLEDE
ncbi:hypothetical protein CALVIDRAFT_563781 [Calocera viscosa TUFC12733]|uniref:Cytoplasmic tRNA 2-thiolation protein 2 n=1 Tax=Calocera viscosa (strain TUFC12733) TaxID=1330018 RepID=A0A167MHF5_CALVF|nr:hypothetical protein CALVIDRAFT_563781 [Calocera viscosa TUFC12733]